MALTRRRLLIAGTTLAAATQAKAWDGLGRGPLTAGEVIDRIKGRVGIPWRTETVDKVVAGRPETPVRGIAVTMMATMDAIERAVAAGRNMVTTHEPTFYSHQDTTEELRDDPTFAAKQRFIAEHDVVVFRFHDHWHAMKPDGINAGMTRELGWEKAVDAGDAYRFVFAEATTLGALAGAMATRLGAHAIRVVGDPGMPVRRVVANWGYGALMPELIKVAPRPDVDVLIVGETREWELVEYVQDQITTGAKKALIVLGHVASEQAGMRYCAEWLRPMVPEVVVEFVAVREPFWVPR